jgi:hypothetical protein
MNSKHQSTLNAIASKPTPKTLRWDDIESLFKAIGSTIIERKGSGICVRYTIQHENGDEPDETIQEIFHRPHPASTAKIYQVQKAKHFLRKTGHLP